MKRKLIFTLIAIISTLSPLLSFSQGDKLSDSNITLTVDTKNITDENKYEEGMVVIDDDRDSKPATGRKGIRSFVTRIDSSKNVTWSGKAKDGSEDQVLIKKIIRKRVIGSRRRLERNNYDGQNGVVKAKARRSNGFGFKHQYFIHLEIKTGRETKEIKLDPKLRLRGRSS